jgi:hypothetical protein
MITSFGKYAVATAALVSAGGLGAIAAQAPAWAGGFSTTYTCNVPMLGSRTAVLDGWLTSPGQTAVSRPTGFRLHISSLNMRTPIALHSWSASAWVTVGGAENSAFRMTGSGGYVPAGQPISGDLTGDWSPAVGGTDLLSVGRIKITATTAMTGPVTAHCVANEPGPVAETLSVQPSYYPGWSGPIAPPYQPGWARPYHPDWNRPIGPPHHIGWDRPYGR